MKKFNKKKSDLRIFFSNYKWIFCTILFLIFVSIFFAILKAGYFVDETYSYAVANSTYGPDIYNQFPDNIISDKILTKSDFYSYLTVDPGQQFDYAGVIYSAGLDTLPPLYYLILHTICSFFPAVFSKWFGLIINIFFHAF